MNLAHIDSVHFDTAVQYAEDLISGKILANEDRILASNRFLSDLKRNDLDFRQEQFDFAINMIEGTIHNVQGEDKNGETYKGKPMLLTDW